MHGKLSAIAALFGLTVPASAANTDVTNVPVPHGLYNVILASGALPGASPYIVYLTGDIDLTTQGGVLGVWYR
jgi:hypothetical protein